MPLRQKIILVFTGIFFFCVLLEAGLRLGGFIRVSIKEYKNKISLQKKGTYRIMCLGESTTEIGPKPYPSQLEEILNQRNIGVKFSVVNRGVCSANTTCLLLRAERFLDEVKPDMVVTMMGINDSGEHLPEDFRVYTDRTPFFKRLRLYSLWSLLRLHILTKVREMRIGFVGDWVRACYGAEAGETLQQDIDRRIASGYDIIAANNYKKAEEIFRGVLSLDPKNYAGHIGLAWSFNRQSKFDEAEAMYWKAIELEPMNARGYIDLGWQHYTQERYAEAEELFEKVIALAPYDFSSRVSLGLIYEKQGKQGRAREQFLKAIELLLSEATGSEDGRVNGRLATLYRQVGQDALADKYYQEANKERMKYYEPGTRRNYLALKRILDQRGIRLVCAQYPVRSVEPLRKIFLGEKGVIFVDNEMVFKKALAQGSYKKYFTDMFGGEFGHCTAEGNRLLARNIADTILRECFHQ